MRVAIIATAIIMTGYLIAAITLNLLVSQRLTSQVDARLSSALAAAALPPSSYFGAKRPISDADIDIDDVPSFTWRVTNTGVATPLSPLSPKLPDHRWTVGSTSMNLGGTSFQLKAARSGSGWLVAGESRAQIERANSALRGPEFLFGGVLMAVAFIGSLIIGLRASAPLELIHRRQVAFTADASHELRTPLSVIEAEVDLALSRPRSEQEYRRVLERISGEGLRLRHVVGELLWLARVDDEQAASSSGKETDVVVATRNCADRFQSVAFARGVDLRVELDDSEKALIKADPEWIDRLVGVLVDNACKFAGRGGKALIRVHHGGGRVVLEVEDDGPGIPASERALVFDRFHRSTDELGGTGLGLAIADSVVRASNGTWSLGNAPSGGAHFAVSWKKAVPRRTEVHKHPPIGPELPGPPV
ncbi:MAG: sensor histidine kinase [Acidimicrobiales bacterium]